MGLARDYVKKLEIAEKARPQPWKRPGYSSDFSWCQGPEVVVGGTHMSLDDAYDLGQWLIRVCGK